LDLGERFLEVVCDELKRLLDEDVLLVVGEDLSDT
jgi:hypothetical protein